MKKVLLTLAILGGIFNSNAQTTETIIQDFNMSAVNSQATYDAAIALLGGGFVGSQTNWGYQNGAAWDASFSYAATATNTAGVAGFAVGEKLVYCTNFGQYSGANQGKVPVDASGVADKDSIASVITTKATLLAGNTYKVKFDVSPRKVTTSGEYYDVLEVFTYQKDGTGAMVNVKTIGQKVFEAADFGKKTITYDLAADTPAGDSFIGFFHTVTGFDSTIDPTVALTAGQQGGLLLDKIVLVETAPLSNDEFLSNKFAVYPNPAKNVLNISNGESMVVKNVTVTDLNGRTVKNVSFDNVANIQVNVSDLASGLYLVNIASDKGIATKKFVKN